MNQFKKSTRIFDLLIAIAIGVILTSNIFRVQQWPFGKEITLISMVSFGLLILFVGVKQFKKLNRNFVDSVGFIIGLLIINIQFNTWLWFTKMDSLVRPLLLLSSVWIIIFVIRELRKKPTINSSFGNILIIIGLSCFVGEVNLRINHLPMGSVLSFAVLFITMIGSIVNFTRHKYDSHKLND